MIYFEDQIDAGTRRQLRKLAQRMEEAATAHELNLRDINFIRRTGKIMGTCTILGDININVGLHPDWDEHEFMIEHTCAHELAHLKHFEHSQAHIALTKQIKRTLGRLRRASLRT